MGLMDSGRASLKPSTSIRLGGKRRFAARSHRLLLILDVGLSEMVVARAQSWRRERLRRLLENPGGIPQLWTERLVFRGAPCLKLVQGRVIVGARNSSRRNWAKKAAQSSFAAKVGPLSQAGRQMR